MRTYKERLTDEIDHAVQQRGTLEDSNLIREILMAVDRYTLNEHGIRPLAGIVSNQGESWVGKYVSMRGKMIDAEDNQRGGL